MTKPKEKNSEAPVRVWERLQLAVGNAGREGFYTCRVSDIKRDRLVISRPEFDHGHSLLANDRVIIANFTRADATYSFTARIKECQPKSPNEMYLVDLGEIKRIQRRRFVRLDKVVKIKYRKIERPLTEMVKLGEGFEDSRTINISAGGVCIEVEEMMDRDAIIIVDFSLSGLKHLPDFVPAICRQCRRREEAVPAAGLEFILREDLRQHFKSQEEKMIPAGARMFDMRMQNELVNELFAEQLVLRQKGLL